MSKLALTPVNVPALASAPTTPTLRAGDSYFNTSNNTLYTYNGTSWTSAVSGTYTFSNTAPSSPTVGDRWTNSLTGILYTYANDGTSSQWVEF